VFLANTGLVLYILLILDLCNPMGLFCVFVVHACASEYASPGGHRLPPIASTQREEAHRVGEMVGVALCHGAPKGN